jgi:diguanylate cyclase (GGDEF)-like protein
MSGFAQNINMDEMFPKKVFILIAILLLIFAGFLVNSVTGYYLARDSITDQIAEQTLPLTSDNVYSEIQRDLLRPVLVSSLMASDRFLRDWILEGEQDPAQIQMYLEDIRANYDTITAFLVSEKTRNYYHPTGIIRKVDLQNPEDTWYSRVRLMEEPYEINIDQDTADRSQINVFINFKVFDYDSNFIGAIGVGLEVSAIIHLIDNYQQQYGRNIYFIDLNGNTTLSASNMVDSQNHIQESQGLTEILPQILSNERSALSYTNNQGRRVFLNTRLLPEFNWYLMVEQEESTDNSEIQSALLVNMGLGFGIMVIVLIAAYFTIKSYQRQLEFMATTDSLTGLANRHAMQTLYDHMSRICARSGEPMSLISIDIDRFKDINDFYGHPAGDEVLKTVSLCIKSHVRESDVVCRFGGEEILVLMSNADLVQATHTAEKLCVMVRNLSVDFNGKSMHSTISCGVVCCHPKETLASAAARADKAMYDAKNSGRDRVCTNS